MIIKKFIMEKQRLKRYHLHHHHHLLFQARQLRWTRGATATLEGTNLRERRSIQGNHHYHSVRNALIDFQNLNGIRSFFVNSYVRV